MFHNHRPQPTAPNRPPAPVPTTIFFAQQLEHKAQRVNPFKRSWMTAGFAAALLLLQAGTAQAAITYIGAGALGAAANAGADPSATVHASSTTDDILLIHAWTRSTADTTTITGFTEIAQVDTTTGSHRWFWKRHDGSEATVTCDRTGTTGDSYCQMFTFRGVITTGNPWNVAGTAEADAAANSFTVAASTAVSDASMIVVFNGYEDNDTASTVMTGTAPAAYTEVYAESSTGTDGAIAMGYGLQTAAASSGTITVDYDLNPTTDQHASLVLALTPVPITLSGTCDQFDRTTDCANDGSNEIRVAVNGTLFAGTTAQDATVDGAWSTTISQPATNDIITVFVNTPGTNAKRAATVTKYSGSGDVTIALYEDHMVIGSDENQSITNANIDNYDYDQDNDIPYQVSGGTLTVDNAAGSSQEMLYIETGDTYAPAGTFNTLNLEVIGTLTMGNFASTVSGTTSLTGTLDTATGATGTRTFTGAVTVNSGGSWNVSGQNPPMAFGAGITQNSNTLMNNGSSVTATTLVGNLAGTGTGGITFGSALTISSGTTTNNYTGGVVTITGNLTNSAGSWAQGNGSSTTFGGATPVSTVANFSASTATNTCTFTNTATLPIPGAGTASTYSNLAIATGVVTSSAVTVGGTLTVSSGTFRLVGSALTVTGATSVTGTIDTLTSATGTKAFNGAVTINSGGVFDTSGQNPTVTFGAGITQNSNVATSFKTGNGASQTLIGNLAGSGTGGINFGGALTVSSGTTTNNYTGGTVTVVDQLTLTGAWTQGANSTLIVQGATPFAGAGAFTASTNANIVKYDGVSQTLPSGYTPYSSLTLSCSTACTLPAADITLRANLLIDASSPVTKSASNKLIFAIGGGSSQTVTDNNATKVDLGILQVSANTGNSTLSSSSSFTATSITVDTSQNLDIAGDTLVLTGTGTALTLSGTNTFTITTSTVQYTGTTATVAGTTFNHLTLGGTGTYTLPAADITLRGNMVVTTGATVTKSASNKIVFAIGGGSSQTLTGNAINSDLGILQVSANTGNSTLTLASNITFTSMTIDASQIFSQGASFNMVTTGAGTVMTVNGIWSNIGTGDITLSGDVTNAGTVTLNSNNGTQCTNAADDIVITSTAGTRTWSGGGTYTVYNVNATNMSDGAITINAYTSTLTSTDWTVGDCGITISGTIYQNDGTTALSCGTSRTVAIRINGGSAATVECSNIPTTGYYEFLNKVVAINDVVTIFLDDETENAVTVTKVGSITNITDMQLYQNRVTVRTETSASAMTILNMNQFDNACNAGTGDTDVAFCARDLATDTFVVDDGSMLLLYDNGAVTATNFTPGGDITLSGSTDGTDTVVDGDLTIQAGATLTMAAYTLDIGGDFANAGTYSYSGTQLTYFSAQTTGHTIDLGTGNFYDIEINDLGNAGGYSFTDANNTVDGDIVIGSGSLTGTTNLTILGGAFYTQTADDFVTFTAGTVTVDGTGTVGSCAGCADWTLYNLTLGDGTGAATSSFAGGKNIITNVLTIAANQTLAGGFNTIIELTASGTPFVINGSGATSGVFNGGESIFRYKGTSATTILVDEDLINQYYTLELKPPSGSPVYTFGSATGKTLGVFGNLVIGDGTNAVTADMTTYDPGVSIGGNTIGDLTVNNNTTFYGPNGTGYILFNNLGNAATITDSNGTKQNLGILATGGTTVVTLGSSITAESFNINSGTGLTMATYTMTITGSGTGSSRPFKADGTFTPSSGTVEFTGTSATEITSTTYNNLSLIPAGTPVYTLGTAGSQTINVNNLTLGNGANALQVNHATYDPVLNIAGNLTLANNLGTFTKSDLPATITLKPTGTKTWSDGNATSKDIGVVSIASGASTPKIQLTGSVGATSVSIAASHELDFNGSNTLTLTGTSTPLSNSGTFRYSTGTTAFTGNGATGIPALSGSGGTDGYYNLQFKPSSSSAQVPGSGTLRVNGALTMGDTTNNGANFDTNDPVTTVVGDVTISANATMTASASAAFNIGGNYSNSGTFTNSSGTITFNATDTGNTIGGTLSGTSDFSKIIFNGSGGAWTLGANLETDGTGGSVIGIRVQAGTLKNGGYSITGNGADDDFQVDNGAFFEMSGTSAYPASYGLYTYGASSTVRYLQTSAASVIAATYGNLEIGTQNDANTVTYTQTGAVVTAGTLTIGNAAGSVHTLSQGASYNLTVGTTTTINTSGGWSNTGTGDISLGGDVTNNGAVTFNSSAGSQCVNITDDIVITAAATRTWTGTGLGAMIVYNVDYTNMAGSVTAYTSNPTTSSWTVGTCGIVISGTVYQSDGSTPYNCTSNVTIRVALNAALSQNVTCTDSGGAYTLPGVTGAVAGDVLHVFVDTATASKRASVVTKANDGTSAITLNIYQQTLIARNENAVASTNANLGQYDADENANIIYTSNANNLIMTAGKLLIWTGKAHTPGGTITTSVSNDGTDSVVDGDLTIQSSATLTMAANALSIGGDYVNSGTISLTGGQDMTFTATATGHTIDTGTGGVEDIIFNGASGGWTFSDASNTITGDLTVTAGTLSGTTNITINGGDLSGNGTIALTGGTFILDGTPGANFGGNTAWSFENLTIGGSTNTTYTATGSGSITVNEVLTIHGSDTLNAGSKTWILADTDGAPATPFVVSGTFTRSTSTIKYATTVNTTVLAKTTPGMDYYNLILQPASGSPTYTLGSATSQLIQTYGVLTIGDGAQALTLTNTTYEATLEIYGTGASFILNDNVTFNQDADVAIWFVSNGAQTITDNRVTKTPLGGCGFDLASTVATLGSNTMCHRLEFYNGAVLSLGANKMTLKGSAFPDVILGANANFNMGTGTIEFDQTAATVGRDVDGLTYYNLNLISLSAQPIDLGTATAQTIIVSNDLTITGDGDVRNDGTWATDAVLDVNGNFSVGGTATFTASNAQSFTIGGNFSNSATYTHSSGTITFDATDTGNTLSGTLTSFNNVTFNGSGGEWTPGSTMTLAGDLVMTAGSLLGTSSVNVNGGAVTGDGIINLTGGTFIVNTAGNFGGATAWTFNNLTIGAAGNATTTATGAGGVTVSGVLTIDTGDTLDAKGKTWTLSGTTGTPLVISGTLNDSTDTSTFSFTGNNGAGNTTIPASTAYHHLTVNNGSEIYVTGGAVTTSGNLTVTAGTFTMGNAAHTIGGTTGVTGTLNTATGSTGTRTFTGAVTINSGGTWDLSGQNPATLFSAGITQSSANLMSNGSGAAQLVGNLAGAGAGGITFGAGLTVNSGTTSNGYTGGTTTVTGTLTLTGNWAQANGSTLVLASATPFAGAGTFSASTSANTVNYTGGAATIKDPDGGTLHTYHHLGLSGTGTKTMTAITTVNGNLTMAGSASATPVITSIGGNLVLNGTSSYTQGANLVVTGTSTIGDGSAAVFNQGATFNFTSGAVTVATSASWTNTGTGDVTLSGDVVNTGTITLNSNSGSQCTDTADDIVVDSTINNTLRDWSGAGTYVMYNINVDDMTVTGTTITIYTSTKSGDTTWTAGGCGITISGKIYQNDGTTEYGCNGNNLTISAKVNGAGSYNATCTNSTGDYSITGPVSTSTNDVVTIFINEDGAGSVYGATVTKVGTASANITNIHIYQNRLTIRTETTAAAMTNGTGGTSGLDYYDNAGDSDINFTVTTNDLVVEDGSMLLLFDNADTATAFTPGGTITTSVSNDGTDSVVDGDLLIQSSATLTMAANALSIGGDYVNSGTISLTGGQDMTFTATATGHTIDTGTGGIEDIIFNGASGGWSFSDASNTITGDLTVTAGTLSGTTNITVNGGDITGDGIINMSGGTFTLAGTPFAGSGGNTAWTFDSLAIGAGSAISYGFAGGSGNISVNETLTIADNATLDPGARLWILTDSDTCTPCAPLVLGTGSQFYDDSSLATLRFTGTGNTTIPADNVKINYGNLELSPASGSPTYTFAANTDTANALITGNLTMGDGAAAITVDMYTNSPIINIDGNITINNNASFTGPVYGAGGGWIEARGGTTQTVTDNNSTKQNIGSLDVNLAGTTLTLGSNIKVNDFTIDNATTNTLNLSSYTMTITGSGTGSSRPFQNLGGVFTPSTGTVEFTGTSATEIESTTYNNLSLIPAGTPVYTLGTVGSQTINVNNLTLGNGANALQVNHATYDPVLNIAGNLTLANNLGTFTKSDLPATITLKPTGTKTWSDGNATKKDIGVVSIASGASTPVINLTSSVSATSVSIAASHELNFNGSNTLSLTGTSTPLSNSGTFRYSTGTTEFTGNGATGIPALSGSGGTNGYYNLQFKPSGASAQVPGSGTLQVNGALTMGDTTNNGANFDTNDPVTTVVGDVTISANATMTASASAAFNIGGNFTNSGTLTHSSGTITFNATDTGNTLSGTLTSFNNVTFNGSGGEWTPSSTFTLAGDLVMTAGSLLGTSSVNVNGGDVTGDGIINLTGGTFTVNTAGNFGGATAWTFNNLTIGAGGDAITTTTGAGGVTVSGVLTIDTGDTLDAKGKTWTLSGTTGTPFVISGTFNDSTDTSTFSFTGNNGAGNTTIPAGTAYNNLTVNNGSEIYVTGGAVTTSGNLTVTAGTFTMGNAAHTIGGTTGVTGTLNTATGATGTRTFTGAVTINSGGTWDLSGQNPATLFSAGITQSSANLMNNGSGAAQLVGNLAGAGAGGITFGAGLTVNSGTTSNGYTGGTTTVTGTLTLTGNWAQANGSTLTLASGTPFAGAGTFSASISANTVNYTGGAATIKDPDGGTLHTYHHLGLSGTGAKTMTAITTINGNLTMAGSASAVPVITTIAGNLVLNGTSSYTQGANLVVTGTSTIGDGSAATFNQGATFNFTSGAVTVNSTASWTNTGTGDVTLSGNVANAGTITLNSGGRNSCGTAGADDIVLTSSDTNARTWSGAGTFSLWDLTVSYMSHATSITTNSSTNVSNNTNWTFAGCGITISGTIFQSGTELNCGTSRTVGIRVNGGSATTVECSNIPSNGSYEFTGVSVAVNDVLSIYLDGETEKGTVVTKPGSTVTNLTGINIYVNYITIRSESGASAMTNTNLDAIDSAGEADILYTVTSGDLTVLDTAGIYVHDDSNSTTSFTPGGIFTTSPSNDGTNSNVDGDVYIEAGATMTIGTNALSVGGDLWSEGTLSLSATQTTTLTATATGHELKPGTNFDTLVLNGSGGGWSFNDASNTINADLTVTAGTLSGTVNITVNGGDVTGNGTINMTGGTFLVDDAGNFGGNTAWTFDTLTFGNGAGATATTATGSGSITATNLLTIAANQTLNAASKTYNLRRANATMITITGPLNQDTSTFNFEGNLDGNVPARTYYNLGVGTLDTTTTNRTYTASGNITVTNNLTVGHAVGGDADVHVFNLDTNNAVLDVNNDLTITSKGTLISDQGATAITIGGNYSNSGTFTNSNGTITFDATDTGNTIGGTLSGASDFSKIIFNGSGGEWTLGANLETDGASATALRVQAGTLKNGGSSITGNGATDTFQVDNSAFFEMSGTSAYPASFTTYTYGATSTVRYLQTNGPTVTNATYGHLDLKPANATPIVLPGTLSNIAGNLTIGDGTNAGATATASNPSFAVAGNMVIAAGATYTTGTGTLTLSGTGSPLTVTGTLTVTSGNTIDFTGAGATNIPARAYHHLGVKPGADVTSHTALAGTITVGGNLTVGNGSNTGTFNVTTNDPILDVNGNVVIAASGTLTASNSAAFTVGGDWTKTGTFTHSSGSVTFDGTGTQTLAGSSAFYNLSATASAARTVNFTAGTTQSIASGGSVTFTGASGQLLTLASTTPDTEWNLQADNAIATQTIQYVSVSDCNAGPFATYAEMLATDGTSTDGGNNSNWDFGNKANGFLTYF